MKSDVKSCIQCKVEKPLAYYYKKSKGLLGVDTKCKQCVLISKKKSYNKKKRAKNRVIEIDDSDGIISEEAILLLAKELRSM